MTRLGALVEMVPITTSGDRQQWQSVAAMGGQGVFTKEIQSALLAGEIDLAVHSLKDLPTEEVPGLCLAAVPDRAPSADVLVCREHGSLESLPEGALIGSGSLRRRAQLLYHRSDLRVEPIRGNVDTRLRKLDRGEYDAIVLAEAGLRRLGLAQRITQVLGPDVCLSAVGQGALGMETRASHQAARDLLEELDHSPTHTAVLAERAMLEALAGGCLAPIAALARVDGGRLTLRGRVLARDGSKRIDGSAEGAPADAEHLGRRTADALIAQGARELIRSAREEG